MTMSFKTNHMLESESFMEWVSIRLHSVTQNKLGVSRFFSNHNFLTYCSFFFFGFDKTIHFVDQLGKH